MKNGWVYLGAFLDDETRRTLIERYKNEIPEGWKLYFDHATLAFNNGSDTSREIFECYKDSLGKNINLCSIAIGRSEEAIALQLVKAYKTANDIFHITMATAPGCKPVKSNFITDWTPLQSHDKINAKIGFFANGKINFTYNG